MSWQGSELFQGLGSAELKAIGKKIREEFVLPGRYFLREGEEARELYYIRRGRVEILKRDPRTGRDISLGTLQAGEIIGELALLREAPRESSVRALSSTELIALPYEVFKPPGPGGGLFRRDSARRSAEKIGGNLARILARRIKERGDETLRLSRERLAMGAFIINVFILLSVYILTLSLLPYIQAKLPAGSSYVSVPLQFLFALGCLHFMRVSGISADRFGLTWRGWRRAAQEGIVFTLPVLALVTLGKYIYLTYSGGPDAKLFETAQILKHYGPWKIILFPAVYIAFSFIQELIARGALQSSLELFFITPRRLLAAILVSNLLFSITHLHISFTVALTAFIPGLFWGALFARHRNLSGVTLSHALLGIYVFFILGTRFLQ